MISFHFTEPFQEYKNFHMALSSYENSIKLLSSVYLAGTGSTADLIISNISVLIGPDDKHFIAKIDDEYAAEGFEFKYLNF